MGEWNGDRISFVVMSFVGFGLEPTSRCFYDVGPDGIVNQDWQRHVNKNRGTKLEQHLTQRSRQQQDNNTRQTKRHLESNKLTENAPLLFCDEVLNCDRREKLYMAQLSFLILFFVLFLFLIF